MVRKDDRTQAVDQFREFVVDPLADQTGEEGDPFQQPFDIGIPRFSAKKRSHRRMGARKLFGQFPQILQLL